MSEDRFIEFKDINFSYDEEIYFQDISLNVRHGETLILYGTGNSGKSFFLRMILGLVEPTGGRVVVDNNDMAELLPEKIYDLRHRMGFVSRDADLINNLTVHDNIALALDFHSILKPSTIERRVTELLKELYLTKHSGKTPAHLHEDAKKKVAFARAIISKPEILLMDESVYGFDPLMSKILLRLFFSILAAHFKGKKLTTIITTSNIHLYYDYGDRFGILYEGHLIFVGTKEELEKSNDKIVHGLLAGEEKLLHNN